MTTLMERLGRVLPDDQPVYPGPLGLGARWTDEDGAVCALWARQGRAVAINDLRGRLTVASRLEIESTCTLALRGLRTMVRSARMAVTDGVPPDGELFDRLGGIGEVAMYGPGHDTVWPLGRCWLATRWTECNRVYRDAVKGLQRTPSIRDSSTR